MKVPPKRLAPATKFITMPRLKLRSWNGLKETIGLA